MPTPLWVLIVEDNPDDAALMLAELRRAGFAPMSRRVETEAAYLAELDHAPDLILADYNLPQFDGLTALQLMRDRALVVPFIIVSGSIGEERAVAAMQSGASDYLLKDRLTRLGAAVIRALQQHKLREAERRSEAAYRFLNEVGRIVTSSLDYRTTIPALARLVVPTIADRCEVYLQRDGAIHRLAAMPEPSASTEAGVPTYVTRVLQSEETDRWVEGTPDGAEGGNGEIVPGDDRQRSPVVATVCVPLLARGRTVGAIAFAVRGSGRHDDPVDIGLFEEIGRLAALAIDNGQLYQEAQEALGARDEFLNLAAHELRTPVTEIKGFAELLLAGRDRAGGDHERQQRYLRRIVEGSKRLTKLAGDLLDVRYIHEGDLPLRVDAVDLAVLAGEVASRHQDQPASHEVVVEAEDGARCVVLGDADRIEQVLVNVLVNAVKFSPGGGTIRIAVARDHDGVRLTVQDQGIGVPRGMTEVIFAPFTRATNSRDRSLPGLGLGLYLCRTIVERHGGRIWAESAGEGFGTTIGIWLPAPPRPLADAPAQLDAAGEATEPLNAG